MVDHTKIVKVYRKIREARAELKRQYEESDAALKVQLDMLEAELLHSLAQNNVSSMRTDVGTFYREMMVKPTVEDWDAYRRWMIENDALDGVEKRVSRKFVQDFMADNKDALPDGIAVMKEYVVKVRAS